MPSNELNRLFHEEVDLRYIIRGPALVRTLQSTWVSRQEALWVREIVRRSRLDGTIDPQTAARLEVYVARERAGLIEDLRKQPPDVILVDNQDSNWGSREHAGPELSALLEDIQTD